MEKIKYYSTNHKSGLFTFQEALLKGLAPDKGLFLPDRIPEISIEEIEELTGLSYAEIAYRISHKFLQLDIPDLELEKIVRDAYNYDVPLEHVYERKYVMRLDQGPTASFKDFAARMMGRLMQYYLSLKQGELLILTATSGDTGSAIANAFYGLENIKVLVLFPRHEVTARQRKQMTTLGKNVTILALDAKFDDCQSLVKEAFSDQELDYLNLSSANSINIGRLLPQIIYYFYSYSRLIEKTGEQAIFSVPSGNFGDMMGGMLAFRMGLPVRRFIIATNENDEFPIFVNTGKYDKIVPSLNCISSAMNVGHPSNLARLVDLYNGIMDENGSVTKTPDFEKMRKEIMAISITDEQTRNTIYEAYKKYKLLLEPHGAVGWSGLLKYLESNPEDDNEKQLCISLETAHPAKFPEQIREILGVDPKLPPSLEGLEEKKENFDMIKNDYSSFKAYLKQKYK